MFKKNIQQFKSQVLNDGIASNNNFYVIMTLPSNDFFGGVINDIIGDNPSLAAYKSKIAKASNIVGNVTSSYRIAFLCNKAQLAGEQIITTERTIQRRAIKTAYGIEYGDLSMSFYLTGDYFIKYFFDIWKNSIVNTSNDYVMYKEEYVADIQVIGLSTNGLPTYGTRYVNAFPVTIGNVDLDSTAKSEILSLDVDFSFEEKEPLYKFADPNIATAINIVGDEIQDLFNL